MEISENKAGIDKGAIGDNKGEIVVYQPDEITRLEVRLKDETVWLNRQQIAQLFGRDVKTIGKHINNALKEELSDVSTVANFAIVQEEGAVKLNEHECQLKEHSKKIDFFIQSSLPLKQGIFFDGQIYDAYTLVAELVRKARRRIVLIDNYIDDTVLTMLSKRADGVEATIYTGNISKQLQLDIDKHNAQYPPITVRTFSKAHDRFMIIDDSVYLVGASIKDLGKKWFGFTLMESTVAEKLLDMKFMEKYQSIRNRHYENFRKQGRD